MKAGDEGFPMYGGCEVTPHDRIEIACDYLIQFLMAGQVCPGVTIYLTYTDAEKLVELLEKGV